MVRSFLFGILLVNSRFKFFLVGLLIASNICADPVIDQATQIDLDLVRKDKTTLGDVINNTVTLSGKKRLDYFLLNPTTSLDVLKNRQQFLSYLLDNNQLYSELKNHLAQLSGHESFLQDPGSKDPLAQKALERVYFSLPVLKRFNSSPYALYMGYLMHITGLCAPLVEHVVMHLGIDLLAGQSHACCSHAGHNHDHEDGNNATYYGLQTLHWALHVPGLYDMGCDIRHRALMMKYLQNEMIHISQYLKRSKDIHAVL